MKGWPTKPLGELVSLEYGKALKAEERLSNGRFPVFGSNGIVGAFDRALVSEPTIVVGRKGAIGEVHLTENGCWPIDTAFYTVLRERNTISLRFLLLWFHSVNLKSLAITSTIPGLNRNTLYSQLVPVPPLTEQERIVKLLDEADELRKLRAQADHRTADLIPSLFHEMFGESKHSWRSSALGELVQDFRYGTSNKSTGEGKPTLRIPNVIQEAVNLDGLKFVPVSDSEFERLRLKDGDLLFVRTNGNADNVGRCAVYDAQAIKAAGYNAEEFIYASYLIRARLQLERVMPLFVQHFLAGPEGCRALRARSKTSAGQFNINTEGLGTIPIPVPPLPLQKEFAARVSEIRAMESEQTASRCRLDELFQSMLHRAFQGEL